MTKNVQFLIFWENEDSSEGLVKVTTRKKVHVYKCLQLCRKVKHATHSTVHAALPEYYILDEGLCILLEACWKLLP